MDEPEDHSLSAMYAAMLGARSETVLFDIHATSGAAPTDEHEAELCRELGAAFSRCLGYQDGKDLRASHQLRHHIAHNSNYEVEKVVRVMNRPHYNMQQAFAENYAIGAPRKVYHGTSQAGAALIAGAGFKGAACRRAMFGKGVYTSPVLWEALAYAKPHSNSKQEIFAVDLLQGPTALGRQDQLDFGVDEHGSEILTLTNPDGLILCASKENQLLARYRFTLRYMAESAFLHRHRECVRVVHGDIAVVIKQGTLDIAAARALLIAAPSMPPAAYAAAAALPALAGAKPRKKAYTDAPHSRFRVGDRVTVNRYRIGDQIVLDMPGTVHRIVKASTFLLCVRPDGAHERLAVQRVNAQPENVDRCSFLRQHEYDLLLLTPGQVHLTRPAPPAPTAHTHTHTHTHTVLGKRQADADP